MIILFYVAKQNFTRKPS